MLELKNIEIDIKKIDNNINNCHKCSDLVEKFSNHTTIYFGNNNDLLILGEAPANNGWRKSKMLWKDINGKILPSGVVLQKLLNPLNIDLFAVTFIEAIKCYPIKRSSLKICKNNCKSYLHEQLKLLKPKIILSLGDAATSCILDFKYKNFKEVVGKVFEIKFDDLEIKVIPIYHPSLISPLSYKGNLPIFENIKKILRNL